MGETDFLDEDDGVGVMEGGELADDDLETRLEIAYACATAESLLGMGLDEFRQALAMLGKVFTADETQLFYAEAVAFSEDEKCLGNSSERDGAIPTGKSRASKNRARAAETGA